MDSVAQSLQLTASSLSLSIAFGAALLAGITDVAGYRIPNWLTFGLIFSGIMFHLILPNGAGWLFSLAGFGLGCVMLLPLFALGGVGAGDVKLLAGIGSWVGVHDTLAIFLVFGLLAGVCSVFFLFPKRWPAVGSHRVGRPRAAGGETNGRETSRAVDRATGSGDTKGQCRLLPMAPMMAMSILILAAMTLASLGRT